MTHQTPEEIRADIERTRSSLSLDVDAVADKVSPSKVAQRQTEKVRNTVGGWKDHVMGSADDASTTVSDQAHHAAEGLHQAPGAAKQKTRGNPLAAGLIALGAGWLAASLVPASEPEKRAAAKLEDQAQPLVDDAKSQAKSMAEELKEPAQESAQRVRDSAAESAQNVKSEGQDQKDTVADSANSSAQDVRG
ncbi:DUF3618 domain-containing protein [Nesterenkonia sp. E16_7]|uniref:DUF3618 domain-containing protein n=1 Tax=unclassified Nesterenkonia TaxID=2629769 RepID=UPI001A9182E7|nr:MULTISPECIES: DUF3618 domain-containing protein [unclassified Nesterenkonia]MBO0595814.1 DUF3618 domain-containing protein [Nesterenkonia sp. E16_10]MBO0599587.1 DUF3618 domain-containing protein [Nesterenkonia sp. E16_7]